MIAAPSGYQLGRAVAGAAELLWAARRAVDPGARPIIPNRQPTCLDDRVEAVVRTDLVNALPPLAEEVVYA